MYNSSGNITETGRRKNEKDLTALDFEDEIMDKMYGSMTA